MDCTDVDLLTACQVALTQHDECLKPIALSINARAFRL